MFSQFLYQPKYYQIVQFARPLFNNLVIIDYYKVPVDNPLQAHIIEQNQIPMNWKSSGYPNNWQFITSLVKSDNETKISEKNSKQKEDPTNEIIQNEKKEENQLIIKKKDEIINENVNPLPKLEVNKQEEEKKVEIVQTEIKVRRRKKKKKIAKKKSNNYINLALRNFKSNIGTGILKYLSYLKDKFTTKANLVKLDKIKKLYTFLRKSQRNLNSFSGWIDFYNNPIWGKYFRIIVKKFFKSSYIISYIANSSIKFEYKKYYFEMLQNFYNTNKSLYWKSIFDEVEERQCRAEDINSN